MAVATLPEIDETDFNPLALGQKYEEEKTKRLRADGIAQYKLADGSLSRFKEDKHSEPGLTREPISVDTEVVIVGGGYGGLLAAVRLVQQGITDFRIVEKGGAFGGTWYWNQYPGNISFLR
jgi:heterodisulfide reductase subunit A-like polyferredoxin